jgi:NADH dehydrogenase FAD-containing subunit
MVYEHCQTSPRPRKPRLLIVGLGFAGMRVLNAFASVSKEKAVFEIVAVDPKSYFGENYFNREPN